MKRATDAFVVELDAFYEKRKTEILNTKDSISIKGTVYYVSSEGNDENDGKTPETPWKTLSKVSAAELQPGDGVLFRRGDTFRGSVETCSGATYGAYGAGDKPKFYGWDRNLADPTAWELYDETHHIWKLTDKILDCGTLVFNEGEAHCRKLIPSYLYGKFVCREDESRIFDMSAEMTRDLDLVCFYEERLTDKPSKGESFPIPVIDDLSFGDLYLRCDRGNPGKVFSSIEALPKKTMFRVRNCADVTIDNLCLKYIGAHAIGAGGERVKGLHVSNCEIGWIGGGIQHYFGTDPNYPQGKRGTVTRYGNGIEIYGGCEDYVVSNCYLYQIYDAGITHQFTTHGNVRHLTGIRYLNNVVEHCVYSIEYFLEKKGGDTESYMEDIEMAGNLLRFSGYGWGQQRHNFYTPAHIKGWSYENTASNYRIHHNVFDRAAYRMVHLVAEHEESCPQMWHNTYIQKLGLSLGQYGGREQGEPGNLVFDENAEDKIRNVFKERDPQVYYIE